MSSTTQVKVEQTSDLVELVSTRTRGQSHHGQQIPGRNKQNLKTQTDPGNDLLERCQSRPQNIWLATVFNLTIIVLQVHSSAKRRDLQVVRGS